MIEKRQDAVIGNRIYWLDNLRTLMIFFVVLIHVGIVYESSGVGGFFWIVSDPSTINSIEIIDIIIDIFVMSVIFFIAGYLAPLSLKNKKTWEFLKSKFKRIMVPWIIAVLTLIPIYKIIFLFSRNLPQESWTSYFHWSNGIWSQNWLWFLPVLYLFDILYLLLSRLNINISKISIKGALGGFFLFGFIYSVCMDFFGGQGWTKTIFIDFQNERLLIYFLIFLLGSLCFKHKTFESKEKSKKFYLIMTCSVWIPLTLYISFLYNSLLNPGKYIFSETIDLLFIQFSFLLSLLYLLYVMINTFRFYLNKSGKFLDEMNKNSYSVYIIHVIVLGGIALTMLDSGIPSLAKYLILIISTYTTSNFVVYFYRKVFKSKILNFNGE
ncbi:acyltransferase [Acidobacteriota bacterium]